MDLQQATEIERSESEGKVTSSIPIETSTSRGATAEPLANPAALQDEQKGAEAKKTDAARAANFENLSRTIGGVAWLMSRSTAHRHLFLADFDWVLIPPLELGQFRLYWRNGLPLAFVSWALLSSEIEGRLTQGVRRLQPPDWRSGESPWIIDIIAPFGGNAAVMRDLRTGIFQGQEIKILRRNESGQGARVEVLKPLHS